MINGKIYLSPGETLVEGVDLLSCRVKPVPKVITDTTLGGAWLVQTVGTPAKRAALALRVVGESTRAQLCDLWAAGASIVVTSDGTAYNGFILEEPQDELLVRGMPEARQYSMTCLLAIQEEDPL